MRKTPLLTTNKFLLLFGLLSFSLTLAIFLNKGDQAIQLSSVPTNPTISSPSGSNVNINPTITGSTYSGDPAHQDTDWKIVSTNDCDSGTLVWSSLADGTNLESINVTEYDGDFTGALSSQKALSYNTTYYACMRYRNADGVSDWDNNSFTVESLSNWGSNESLTITETSGTTLNDYQTRIVLSDPDIDFDSIRANGTDLRLTDSTATYGIPYYIEDWDDVAKTATIWARIPTLTASSGTVIKAYIDNSSATTTPENSGSATFHEFLDEDYQHGWEDGYSTGGNFTSVSASGEYLHFSDTSGSVSPWYGKTLHSESQSKTSFTWEHKFHANNGASVDDFFIINYDGSTSHRFSQFRAPHYLNQAKFGYRESGSNKNFSSGTFSWGTDYIVSTVIDGAANQVDYIVRDSSYSTVASQINESFPDGSPTNPDNIVLGVGGSQKAQYYLDFFAMREYSTSEPTLSIGSINLISAIAKDTDDNGQIDEIDVQFSRNVDGASVDNSDFTISGYTINSNSTTGSLVTLGVTEKAYTSSTVTLAGEITATDSTSISSGNTPLISDTCPTTDLVGSTITIDSNTTWDTTNINSLGGYLDCSGVDIHVTNNSTLTFDGDTTTNGYYVYVKAENITIDSGSSIAADGEGCASSITSPYDGYGPNGSNVCTISVGGGGEGGTSNISAGGGGYGGDGGHGKTVTYDGGKAHQEVDSDPVFGASGGSTSTSMDGGPGGGIVRLNVIDTLTHNGTLSATGGNGETGNGASGGGSGGAIHVVTDKLAGSTGTFDVTGGTGGNGGTNDGGGGGGGRVYLSYASTTYTLDNADFTLTGGTGPDSAEEGDDGSAYILDTSSNDVTLYGSYYIDEGTKTLNKNVSFHSTANIECHDDVVDGEIAFAGLALKGTIYCDDAVSLNSAIITSSTTTFDVDGVTLTAPIDAATIEFDMADSTSSTWNNFNITTGEEGQFKIDDPVTITTSGTNALTTNINWTGLTAVTLASGTTIDADEFGCKPISSGTHDGAGPNGSNVCTQSTAGFGDGSDISSVAGGGGAYGGAGGAGSNSESGGATYSSNSAPTLFGSSGGTVNNAVAGAGGGLVRIDATGTITHNGSISVNGGNGINNSGASGGGSGGAIYLSSDTFTGTTGSLSADGGDGGNGTSNDGGGGGGGRVAVTYTTDNSSYLAGLTANGIATGGNGPGAAENGGDGTLFRSGSNATPSIDSLTISTSSGGGTASSLNLTENTSTTIYIHGEITDTDGCTDVETDGTVTGAFYRTNVTNGSSCTADNNDCYQISGGSCTLSNCTGGGDNTFNYECTAAIQYYADATDAGSANAATDWTAYIIASDDEPTNDTSTATTEMNSLIALSAPATVNYGNVSLDTESSQQDISVINTGNSPIDIQIKGNTNMTCTSGSIDVGQVHYSTENGFNYASGSALTTSLVTQQFDLAAQTNDLSQSQKSLYTKLKLPTTGVGGSCSNTLTINALTDS